MFHKLVTSSGLRIANVSDNCMEIEMSDIYNQNSEDVATLRLTVHFGEPQDGFVPVEDITVGVTIFS